MPCIQVMPNIDNKYYRSVKSGGRYGNIPFSKWSHHVMKGGGDWGGEGIVI